ncbi:MAG: DNA recombination protein RmuC [Chloroflexi bacterium]|nr:DNA recombination protein RmuC [Chloroflexota bacterium]
MDLMVAVAGVSLLFLVAGAVLWWRGRPQASAPRASAQLDAVQQAMHSNMTLLQQAIGELGTSNAQAIADLRGEVQRSLGATEQQLLTQTGSTQRVLGELSQQLGSLGEQSARIGELAKDIGSLQDLLRAPKLRGGFGELLMERLLEDNLPVGSYELQYAYRNGLRVDAVVRFSDRLVPIDAKFPIESFNALRDANDDTERKSKRRAFLQQVKRHVDAVSRYISPEDGTVDFAFLYVPAENVFYECLIRDDPEIDLWTFCNEKRVIPASPNTLVGYLRVVSLGLRGLAMQERTRELQREIQRAALELGRFRDQHDQLGKHLVNAANKHAESVRALDRATDAVTALARTPLAEQSRLPLPRTPDELLGDALGAASVDREPR